MITSINLNFSTNLEPFIYGTLIGLVISLTFATYFCVNKYVTLKSNNSTFTFTSDVNAYLSLSVTWLVIGIICAVILIVLFLIILILIKRLWLAIQIICEASKAITSVFLSVIFPVIPLLLQLAFLVYFIAVAVYLACSGSSLYKMVSTNTSNSTNTTTLSSTTTSCDPSVSVSSLTNSSTYMCLFYRYGVDSADNYINAALVFLNDYQWLPQLYNLFMLFWTQAFLSGLNQMVLAGKFLDSEIF